MWQLRKVYLLASSLKISMREKIYIYIYIVAFFWVFDLPICFNLENMLYGGIKSWKTFHHVFHNNCLEFQRLVMFFCLFYFFLFFFIFGYTRKDWKLSIIVFLPSIIQHEIWTMKWFVSNCEVTKKKWSNHVIWVLVLTQQSCYHIAIVLYRSLFLSYLLK